LDHIKVLDSWALLAYFEGEKEGLKVAQVLKEASERREILLISVVNWGEVLYVTEGRYGRGKRDEVERLIDQMQIEIADVNREITHLAAHLKATEKLPYGDSFAAALALSRKAKLITGDKDFRCVETKIQIQWL
jgi:uncharacterized protein with PIN domain